MDLFSHKDFNANVNVFRLEDTGRFVAEVRVTCAECNTPFRFKGVPPGINQPHPCTNIDGLELSCEIEPEGVKKLATRIPIHMPKLPEKV